MTIIIVNFFIKIIILLVALLFGGEKSYSNVLSWVRARLGFALIRATVLCLHGSCTHWRSLDFEDGAAI